jgi:hypothetical protein
VPTATVIDLPLSRTDYRMSRRRTAFHFATLLFILLSAACADSTISEPGVNPVIGVGTAGPDRAITLEPIVVVGECDPYTALDFCQGDGGACMTGLPGSSEDMYTSSCPGGGGGGGSPGTAAPAPAPPLTSLPGDADGDGDTWDEGPGVWILCISTILGTAAGGAGTYFTFEDYHHKVDVLNAAKLRVDHYSRNYGAYGSEYLQLSNAYYDAKEEARIAAGIAASSAGVTVAALIGAGVVCAPLIAAPTP